MAANISSIPMQVTSQPVSSVSKQASFSTLPTDIQTSIFALLPLSDLATTSCVNRSWREWTKDKRLWEHRLSQDVRANFAPLINEGRLSWQEAYRYTSLSHFVSDTIVKRMTNSIRLQKNPTLGTVSNPHLAIPKPYIQYGNYSFTICDLTNIEIQEEGNPTLTLLPGEKEKPLTHLAVESDILFVLRADGRILRLNYKTKEILQDIHTDLETSLNSPAPLLLRPPHCSQFYVKNGYIIMTSVVLKHDTRETRLEIIPYGDPEKRQIFNNDQFADPDNNFQFSEIILQGNQMIGRRETSIWIKNLSNHNEPKIYNFHYLIYNMTLDLHTLYVFNEKQQVHKIDLKSGNLTERFNSLAYQEIIGSSTAIVNDLAFTFQPSKKVTVEDLQSGANEILLEDQLQEIHNQEIHDVVTYKENLLKKLIERVKRKPSSYPRFKKIFRSILKSNFVRFLRKFIIPIMGTCIAIISLIRRLKLKQ